VLALQGQEPEIVFRCRAGQCFGLALPAGGGPLSSAGHARRHAATRARRVPASARRDGGSGPVLPGRLARFTLRSRASS